MFFKATFIAFFIHQLVSFTHCSPVDFSAPTTTNSIEARAPKSFAHPGVFLDKAQLNFIKGKVNSGAEPWSTAYKSMLFNDLASLTRSARPWATVECGRDEIPNKGCTDELYDGVAAYAMSLAWYISGNAKYAQKAISYMNIWAKTLKSHTEFNANLQTAWAAVNWARAAEIIRHTNAGWSYSDITAFEKMLREVYLPPVIGGSEYNGNWELAEMQAALSISVFLDDDATYNQAMSKFLSRVPAYIYLKSDGPYPKVAPGSGLKDASAIKKYWQNQQYYLEDGFSQETCRDFTHNGYGLASIGHVAETSRIQGTDLYGTDVGTRLRHALEFHSKLELGNPVPSWVCNGTVHTGLGLITEVGFNALSTRMGYKMDQTKILTRKNRPAGTNHFFVGFETLTHAVGVI